MMEAEALRQAVEHAGYAAAGVAFLAGFAFSFNPVALASIRVSLAYLTKARDKSQALFFGMMFILGMILTPCRARIHRRAGRAVGIASDRERVGTVAWPSEPLL